MANPLTRGFHTVGRRRRIDRIVADADARGDRVVSIDASDATTKSRWMAVFAEALALPEWFGANWDAVADVLGDVDEPLTLIVDHASCPSADVTADVVASLRSITADLHADDSPLTMVVRAGRPHS